MKEADMETKGLKLSAGRQMAARSFDESQCHANVGKLPTPNPKFWLLCPSCKVWAVFRLRKKGFN